MKALTIYKLDKKVKNILDNDGRVVNLVVQEYIKIEVGILFDTKQL